MIPFDEARRVVLERVHPLPSWEEDFFSALGCALAEEVVSDRALPPFSCSAVDGFALCSSDTASLSAFRLVGASFAGGHCSIVLKQGEAVRIATGAPLPQGADAVVREEDAQLDEGWVKISRRPLPGEYIRRAGQEIEPGVAVFFPGTPLGPWEVGMLASLGRSKVLVHRRPRVAIFAIGDELRELHEADPAREFVGSNSYMLAAAVFECGAIPVRLGIVRDDLEEVVERMGEGLGYDMAVTSGGSGRGKRDLAREALAALGATLVFDQVAVKPGGSSAFAFKDGVPLFCLPGGPAAAFLGFEAFVRPALRKMMGFLDPFRPRVKAIVGEALSRGERTTLLLGRVEAEGERYRFTRVKGKVNAIAILPELTQSLPEGEEVAVELLL